MSNKIRIAFYKGSGLLRDKLIRRVTRSNYSHVELVLPSDECSIGIRPPYYSVVTKRSEVIADDLQWDFIDIDASDAQLESIKMFYCTTAGQGYDWIGMFMSHVIPFKVKQNRKWYCSEWVACALGSAGIIGADQVNLYDCRNISPGKLHDVLFKNKKFDSTKRKPKITNFAASKIEKLFCKATGGERGLSFYE